MAAGEVDDPAVARGVNYLVRTQGQDGLWIGTTAPKNHMPNCTCRLLPRFRLRKRAIAQSGKEHPAPFSFVPGGRPNETGLAHFSSYEPARLPLIPWEHLDTAAIPGEAGAVAADQHARRLHPRDPLGREPCQRLLGAAEATVFCRARRR
jgi:hypothetical protein